MDFTFTQLHGNNESRRLARPATPVSAGVMDGFTFAPIFSADSIGPVYISPVRSPQGVGSARRLINTELRPKEMEEMEDRDRDIRRRQQRPRQKKNDDARVGRYWPSPAPFPPIALWRHRGVFWWEAEGEGREEESLLEAL